MKILWIFRLYAGIVIIVNYILMMTWLPATVIIVEKMNIQLCKCWQSYVDSINLATEKFGICIQNAIIRLIGKFKYLFLVIFCKYTIHLCAHSNGLNYYCIETSADGICINILTNFIFSSDRDNEWDYRVIPPEAWTARLSIIPIAR